MQVFSELSALIDATSNLLITEIDTIQSDPRGGAHGDGVVRLVLTGGTAGIALLKQVRERENAESRIDWSRVHVFFGDERNVPVSHPDSNEGQARDALLDHVAIPAANIHGYALEGGNMDSAVSNYAEALEQYAPQGFDIHLLGMGGEGHINSLFPHTGAVRERGALVVAVTDSPNPPPELATLTLPAVQRADRVWLLVSGAEKAEAAAAFHRGADPEDWPVAGAQGRLETELFITEDAASQI